LANKGNKEKTCLYFKGKKKKSDGYEKKGYALSKPKEKKKDTSALRSTLREGTKKPRQRKREKALIHKRRLYSSRKRKRSFSQPGKRGRIRKRTLLERGRSVGCTVFIENNQKKKSDETSGATGRAYNFFQRALRS